MQGSRSTTIPGLDQTSVAALSALRFPVQYLEVAETLVARRNGRVAEVRRACGLPDAADPAAPTWIDGCQLIKSVELAVDHCLPDQPPSLQILAHFPLTAHGALGLLAMTCPTIGDALDAALRYHTLVMPLFELHRESESHIGTQIRVTPTVDLGPWSGLMAELVIGAMRNVALYTQASSPALQVDFKHDSKWAEEAYTGYFGIAPRFGSPWNGFFVRREFLNTPLTTGSRTTHAHTHEVLMRELKASPQHTKLGQEVKQRLLECMNKGHVPTSDFIATAMAMSVRTLSRRLAEDGMSFSGIADQIRLERAEHLLQTTQLSLVEIAKVLGFADASSFTRAFRRATGDTPGSYREKVR